MNTAINYRAFDPFPILNTGRLCLREFTIRDAQALLMIRGDMETMKYMDSPLHQTLNDSKSMIADISLAFREQTGINWVIEEKEEGLMIGYIGFWRILAPHVRAEIGYALNRNCWGKGLMKEAAQAVLDFGFTTLRLHSVEANVNPGNKASIRMLGNLGFMKEGHLKENYFVNEHFVDTVIFSLREDDFCS